jgi:pimeloyl-ACP methyl ester carboxylesterase
MAELVRRDGARIHWEERGEGPAVVLVPHCFVYPSVFEPIAEELATDHRVIRYDVRGAGDSTRVGPFDLDTGAGDLEAVIEEVGGPAVTISIGDASNRAVRVAASRPELISAFVGIPPMSISDFAGTDAMAASRTVVAAMLEMVETDYRGALRTLITSGNPQMDEEEIRERVRGQVEYCPRETAVPMFRSWIADDATALAREVGGRLWAIYSDRMAGPWFPPAREFTEVVRQRLPQAHTNELEEGIVSRPDLTAELVRRITARTRSPAA